MSKAICFTLALMSLGGCLTADPADVYTNPDRVWALTALNGSTFSATATLTFPKTGGIAGKAPCNCFFGEVTGVYPQFEVGPLGSTRMACPDLRAEAAYFRALEAATTATATDNTLILTNTSGLEMIFKSTD